MPYLEMDAQDGMEPAESKFTTQVYQTLGSAGKPSQLRRRNQLRPGIFNNGDRSIEHEKWRYTGKLHDVLVKPYAEVHMILLREPKAHY